LAFQQKTYFSVEARDCLHRRINNKFIVSIFLEACRNSEKGGKRKHRGGGKGGGHKCSGYNSFGYGHKDGPSKGSGTKSETSEKSGTSDKIGFPDKFTTFGW
jgi:hypothetical protein